MSGRLTRLLERIDSRPEDDPGPLVRGQQFLKRVGQLFVDTESQHMSAAIAFYALISFIPFALLVLSVAGFVMVTLGGPIDDPTEAAKRFIELVEPALPTLGNESLSYLEGLVRRRNEFGITGIISLVLFASLVFQALDHAFLLILPRDRRRRVWAGRLLAAGLVFSLLFLVVGLLYIGAVAQSLVPEVAAWLQRIPGANFLASVGLPFAGTWVFFVVLSWYFARDRLARRFAMWGALLYAGLFVLARLLFGLFLNQVANHYSAVFGSLASLIALVFWIYFSSIVMLLSAVFARVMQENAQPTESTGQNEAAESEPAATSSNAAES